MAENMVWLVLCCQVLVQAQLIKSEPQSQQLTQQVMYTSAPVTMATSRPLSSQHATSLHTLVTANTPGTILATGENLQIHLVWAGDHFAIYQFFILFLHLNILLQSISSEALALLFY